MPFMLHIPGEPSRALRWTTAHPASSYGGGVLLYRNGNDMLDGAKFRALRDGRGAWLETDRPDRARRALALLETESLGHKTRPADWETYPSPFADCLKAWRTTHGWTWQQTADELRKPLTTVQGMAKGRVPGDEASLRRLMTLIDRRP